MASLIALSQFRAYLVVDAILGVYKALKMVRIMQGLISLMILQAPPQVFVSRSVPRIG